MQDDSLLEKPLKIFVFYATTSAFALRNTKMSYLQICRRKLSLKSKPSQQHLTQNTSAVNFPPQYVSKSGYRRVKRFKRRNWRNTGLPGVYTLAAWETQQTINGSFAFVRSYIF